MQGPRRSRRRVLAALALLAAGPRALAVNPDRAPMRPPRGVPDTDRGLRERQVREVDLLWREVERGYAGFDAARRERWQGNRARWRSRASLLPTHIGIAGLVAEMVATLRDERVWLVSAGERPVRRVPQQSDIWARWDAGAARVEAVRVAGDADVAGLRPGVVVENVQGVAVARAVERLVGADAPQADRDWAVRRLLAGPWSGSFALDVRDAGKRRRLEVERTPPDQDKPSLATQTHRVGEARDVGWIRPRAGDLAPPMMDASLRTVGDVRALLVDLRDPTATPSRAAVEAWASRLARPGHGPVVALVDRWTHGESEVLAALLRASGARLAGTPTAGLASEGSECSLPTSGLAVRFPTAAVTLAGVKLDGPLPPDVAVDLAAPSGGPGDPILYAALKLVG